MELATGRLRVGDSKTEAGLRDVSIRPVLRDELLALKMTAADASPDSLVFGTATGRQQGASNVRRRVLALSVERANELLADRDANPLPDRLSPHSLRRTFASVLYAIGEDPPTVMAEMGHTSRALALAIYAQAMRRSDGEKASLRALVEGAEWANMGQRDGGGAVATGAHGAFEHEETSH